MDHLEVGRYRDQNAPTWTRLSRAGYDVYRDLLNSPAYFELLPDVTGRRGLDLGCGEGHNTRLLAREGFLQFSIEHPLNCSRRGWVRDESGRQLARTISGYFDGGGVVDTWLFGTAPADLRATLPAFRVPRFRRTLSQWVNAVAVAGLVIEAAAEPGADDSTALAHPEIADSRIVPPFLQLRCRKPQPA